MLAKIVTAAAACLIAGAALVFTISNQTSRPAHLAAAAPTATSTTATKTPAQPEQPKPAPSQPAPSKPASSQPAATPPAESTSTPAPAAPAPPPGDWQRDEAHLLKDHVQITSREQFFKAGEAYFSPDSLWIIFQAIPAPKAGQEPDPFYSMYAAELVRDPLGRITGIRPPVLLSNPGTANTCGFFHPQTWARDLYYDIMFASTLVPPSDAQPAGFRVGERTYRWQFPEEMEIVRGKLASIEHKTFNVQTRQTTVRRVWEPYKVEPVFKRDRYDAECAFSPDGRYIVYARVRDLAPGEEPQPRPEVDIWIFDVNRQKHHPIITADGYDGGPFFSPDGKRLCYRSDRRGDDRLQIFVADLAFDADGAPSLAAEHQLTDNDAVNWAPYWHPSGKYVVFASSLLGHHNYEVFAVEADTTRSPAQLTPKRITHAAGADVLPVFNREGNLMMWTAQRGAMAAGEQKPSSQIWIATVVPGGLDDPEKFFADAAPESSAEKPN